MFNVLTKVTRLITSGGVVQLAKQRLTVPHDVEGATLGFVGASPAATDDGRRGQLRDVVVDQRLM